MREFWGSEHVFPKLVVGKLFQGKSEYDTESAHVTPLLVGIRRGIIIPGFLNGGARNGFRNHPQHETEASQDKSIWRRVSVLDGSLGGSQQTDTWLWVKTNGIPFWGRCTTHFRTYFSGDWDVHWGCDLDLTLPMKQNQTPRR